MRPWQVEIVAGLFDEPRPRQGVVSVPRGNGKSTLAAMLGLYGLLGDGVEGAQVLCVASDQRQAGIVFNAARRMVELNPVLESRVQIFKDRLYVPHTDSMLVPLPAEPGALQGYDPSLAVVDELHVVTTDVYDAMALAAGKRDHSLVLAISTPAASSESVMWRLVEHGRTGNDPTFYFREFAAPDGCAVDDEDAWEAANPALDDFLHRDALRATLRTTRESAWRRFRLGQWVDQVAEPWFPSGAWETCAEARGIDRRRGRRVGVRRFVQRRHHRPRCSDAHRRPTHRRRSPLGAVGRSDPHRRRGGRDSGRLPPLERPRGRRRPVPLGAQSPAPRP